MPGQVPDSFPRGREACSADTEEFARSLNDHCRLPTISGDTESEHVAAQVVIKIIAKADEAMHVSVSVDSHRHRAGKVRPDVMRKIKDIDVGSGGRRVQARERSWEQRV